MPRALPPLDEHDQAAEHHQRCYAHGSRMDPPRPLDTRRDDNCGDGDDNDNEQRTAALGLVRGSDAFINSSRTVLVGGGERDL